MARHVFFFGKQDFFFAKPMSLRTRLRRSSESDRSRTVNEGSRPMLSPCSRSKRVPIAWKVPDQVISAAGPKALNVDEARTEVKIRSARRVISSAARRVNVRSRSRSGGVPVAIRWAPLCASVSVLPVPAPAIMRSGPEMWEPVAPGTPYSTAARWSMFKLRKYVGLSTVEAPLWPHRTNPPASAGGLAKISTRAGTVSQILFIASTQIFANACMRGLYDIDPGSAEPETTHYRDSPNGLPHGRTRLREERS